MTPCKALRALFVDKGYKNALFNLKFVYVLTAANFIEGGEKLCEDLDKAMEQQKMAMHLKLVSDVFKSKARNGRAETYFTIGIGKINGHVNILRQRNRFHLV